MKKLMTAALALALLATLSACGKKEEPVQTAPPALTEAPATAPMVTEAPTTLPTVPPTTEAPTEETIDFDNFITEPSTEPVPDTVSGTVTGKFVNVRSGPSGNTKVVGKRVKGDRVEIYEAVKMEKNYWGRMEDGWITLQYVKLDGPVPAMDPQNGIPALVIGTQSLNVRESPSVSAKKVTTLRRYDSIRVLETRESDNAYWCRIQEGWVSKQYLKLSEPVQGILNTGSLGDGKAPAETTEPTESTAPEETKPAEKPETDKPGTDKPETNKPETNKPETDKPETSKPETNQPEDGGSGDAGSGEGSQSA